MSAGRLGSTEFVPPSGGIQGAVEQDPGPENLHFGVTRPPEAAKEPSQRSPLVAGVGFLSILRGFGVPPGGHFGGIGDTM